MRLFKKLDLYALPVTLRYKGEKKFYTNFGACVSLSVILTLVAIIYGELVNLVSRGPSQMTVSSSAKLVGSKCNPLDDATCAQKLAV